MHATAIGSTHAKSSKVTAVHFCLQEVRGEKQLTTFCSGHWFSGRSRSQPQTPVACMVQHTAALRVFHVLYLPFSSRHPATPCGGACVELEPDTEAVANKGFKLGCISCKKRGEVRAVASVSWSFKAEDEEYFSPVSDNKSQQTRHDLQPKVRLESSLSVHRRSRIPEVTLARGEISTLEAVSQVLDGSFVLEEGESSGTKIFSFFQ